MSDQEPKPPQVPAIPADLTHEVPSAGAYENVFRPPNFDEQRAALDEHVDTFLGSALSESIKAAFRSETIDLFMVGLPVQDSHTVRRSIVQRVKALNNYAFLLSETYTADGEVRSLQASGKVSAAALRNSTENIKNRIEPGLMNVSGVDCTLGPLQIIYRKEGGLIWDDNRLVAPGLADTDRKYLYGDDIDPGELTSDDLSTDLRYLNPPDLGQELLDSRLDAFLGLLHVGMSTTILSFLRVYGSVNRARAMVATDLADYFKDVVVSGSIVAKQQAFDQLQRLLQNEAERTQAPTHKQLFGVMGDYLERLRNEIGEFTDFFRAVYTNLPVAEHPYFSEIDAAQAAQEAETAAEAAEHAGHVALPIGTAVVGDAEVVFVDAEAAGEPGESAGDTAEDKDEADAPPDDPSPEVIAEIIMACRDALQARIEGYKKEWQLSHKQRKELRLDALRRAFTSSYTFTPPAAGIGYEPPTKPGPKGPEEMEPVPEAMWSFVSLPEDHVEMMLGVVTQLRKVERAKIPGLLEGAAAAQQDLSDAQTILKHYADQRGYDRLGSLDIPDIARHLQRIADNWHLFVRIFDENGPEGFAGDVWNLLPEPTPGSPYQRLRDARPPADFTLDRAASNTSSVSGAEMVE